MELQWIHVTDEDGNYKGTCPTTGNRVCIGGGEIQGVVVSEGKSHYTPGIAFDPLRRENPDTFRISNS